MVGTQTLRTASTATALAASDHVAGVDTVCSPRDALVEDLVEAGVLVDGSAAVYHDHVSDVSEEDGGGTDPW